MAVTAIVPAWNEVATVARTVGAARAVTRDVLVVDDGSADGTAPAAAAAGARVVRLPRRCGKAAAVLAGAAVTAGAVIVLIDADVGDTAAEAARLVEPVQAGAADMAIALLPPSGARGGRGFAVGLARRGIRLLAGVTLQAPLSGQRALRREVLRAYRGARGFGLEVGLTIDALRAGFRVVEVPAAMRHRVGDLGLTASLHRALQGRDVAWTLARRSLVR